MNQELSKLRLHSMRLVYLLTAVFLGSGVWPVMINRTNPWDPLHGIAFSFWCAYSALMLIGVRFPVRMLPLLLLQFFYKTVWMIFVGYPLWRTGQLTPLANELIKACGYAAIMDLFVIPWPYVFTHFVRSRFAGGAVK